MKPNLIGVLTTLIIGLMLTATNAQAACNSCDTGGQCTEGWNQCALYTGNSAFHTCGDLSVSVGYTAECFRGIADIVINWNPDWYMWVSKIEGYRADGSAWDSRSWSPRQGGHASSRPAASDFAGVKIIAHSGPTSGSATNTVELNVCFDTLPCDDGNACTDDVCLGGGSQGGILCQHNCRVAQSCGKEGCGECSAVNGCTCQ